MTYLPSVKKCPVCLITKSADEFGEYTVRSGRQTGHSYLEAYCKPCNRAFCAEWVKRAEETPQAYLERKKLRTKQWYVKNRTKILTQQKEYVKKMTPAQKEARRVVRNANLHKPEVRMRVRKLQREWRKRTGKT